MNGGCGEQPTTDRPTERTKVASESNREDLADHPTRSLSQFSRWLSVRGILISRPTIRCNEKKSHLNTQQNKILHYNSPEEGEKNFFKTENSEVISVRTVRKLRKFRGHNLSRNFEVIFTRIIRNFPWKTNSIFRLSNRSIKAKPFRIQPPFRASASAMLGSWWLRSPNFQESSGRRPRKVQWEWPVRWDS